MLRKQNMDILDDIVISWEMITSKIKMNLECTYILDDTKHPILGVRYIISNKHKWT